MNEFPDREKKELPGYNNFQSNFVYLLYAYDGSVAKVQEYRISIRFNLKNSF